MQEALDEAAEELKRVDHLIFVSLKYTRTVDMIRHGIERCIACFDFLIESLLKYAKSRKKIDEIPSNPGTRAELIRKLYSKDSKLIEFISLYSDLRKLMLVEYTKTREYRRHVAMLAKVDGKPVEINIDVVTQYYEKAKEYLPYFLGFFSH